MEGTIYKLVLLGSRNAGKTRLLSFLQNASEPHLRVGTIGADAVTISVGGSQMRVWDVGGAPQYRKLARSLAAGADMVFVCFSTVSSRSLTEAELWLHELKQIRRNKSPYGVTLLGMSPPSDSHIGDDVAVSRAANALSEIAHVKVHYVRDPEAAERSVSRILQSFQTSSRKEQTRDMADTCCHML